MRKFIDTKKLDIHKLLIINKNMMLVIGLNKN